jgi:hypothetical protein
MVIPNSARDLLFSYVSDSPLSDIDPSGLCGETPFGPYDNNGCPLPHYPLPPGYGLMPPCIGLFSVWHPGCPPHPAPATDNRCSSIP